MEKKVNEFVKKEGLNQRGLDMIEAYKIFINPTIPAIVKESLKGTFLGEKAKDVREAVKNEVSLEDFETVLKTYSVYMKGNSDFVGDAMEYVQENMHTSATYTVLKKTASVVVQKRVGLKATEVEEIFGVDARRAHMLVASSFVETFVDTFMRKKIMQTIEKHKDLLHDVKVNVSNTYKVDGRNMFDINVDFCISPSKLTSETCERVARVVEALENEVNIR